MATKLADDKDGKVTNFDHKKYDASNPIHRIESPDFSTTRAGVDGVTTKCREAVKPPFLIGNCIPAWTDVPNSERNPDREIEGALIRSYQTWTDFPVFQYHRWYDWNLHIEPAEGFKFLRGAANQLDPAELQGRTAVIGAAVVEVEWDCGAFGKPSGGFLFGPGPMFVADWAWPMAGQNAWARGRWVYDCAHANSRSSFPNAATH